MKDVKKVTKNMAFNKRVEWTESWKRVLLESIERKRSHLDSNDECPCCVKARSECYNCIIGPAGSPSICWLYINTMKGGASDKELLEFLDRMKEKAERTECKR